MNFSRKKNQIKSITDKYSCIQRRCYEFIAFRQPRAYPLTTCTEHQTHFYRAHRAPYAHTLEKPYKRLAISPMSSKTTASLLYKNRMGLTFSYGRLNQSQRSSRILQLIIHLASRLTKIYRVGIHSDRFIKRSDARALQTSLTSVAFSKHSHKECL
jgi:hypothetical protein